MKTKTNLKAFRGPNGWYIAEEDDETGTHYQPQSGGSMTRAQALAALAEAVEAEAAEDAESSEWGGR